MFVIILFLTEGEEVEVWKPKKKKSLEYWRVVFSNIIISIQRHISMILTSKYFHIFRPLVAVLSPRRSGLVPRPFNARFIVEKEAQVQTFLRVLTLLPVSIFRLLLHIHLHLNYALNRWIIKGVLGTFKTSNTSSDITVALRSKFLIFRPQRAK
jgi:hypothetical protein